MLWTRLGSVYVPTKPRPLAVSLGSALPVNSSKQMRLSSPHLRLRFRFRFVAAASVPNTTAMSSRPSYLGGRNQGRRGFSDRPGRGGRGGRGELVTGDSHYQSVRDANVGFRQGNLSEQTSFQPQPFSFNPRPPPPRYHNRQQFRQPPPHNQYQTQRPLFNQIYAPRPFRPRPQKPLDYRSWEHSKTAPPPNSERFTVLSYNILADYLATSHRPKLYFHIPRYMLDWGWRKRSLIFELGLWSTDIMCFQEVDRFQDLEEELKIRGYNGIWKMRTGNAIDGCAIFWRSSRFKLLYDESIEFNKFDLRDNVAQICVLELLNQNDAANTASPLRSSTDSYKAVICNIHVLFNPKRGEIKLGQVRRLLDRAHAVSRMWNNAPVVLCGDFNCTPKSPLYNFITEQKLDLLGLDRDKVSGQASAEIRSPRPFNPNPGPELASSIRHPPTTDDKEAATESNDSSLDILEASNIDRNVENDPSVKNLSQPNETVLGSSSLSCTILQCGSKDAQDDEETKLTQQATLNFPEAENESPSVVPVDNSRENSSNFSEGRFPFDQMNENLQKFTPPTATCSEDLHADLSRVGERGENAASHSIQGASGTNLRTNISTENQAANFGNLVTHDHSTSIRTDEESSQQTFDSEIPSSGSFCQTQSPDSLEVSTSGISASQTSELIVNNEKGSSIITYQVDFSSLSAGIEEKVEKLSLEGETLVESINEDEDTFLAALHGKESDLEISSPQNWHLTSPSDEVLDDLSPFEEKTTYNPSLWTPMDIATATGSEDCTCLEHPLQLKSTYTEVEDCSGTRDSNREPLVTSYNRCFMGTLDYIWRSKGLQTVKVLAPMPKKALEWTPGFPTKKWGSDHIALASELAFVKDEINQDAESSVAC
ncbi:hypothetical protein SLA2020_519420 [Shorea laevis]